LASADAGSLPAGATARPVINILTDVESFTTQDTLLSDGAEGPGSIGFRATVRDTDGGPVEPDLSWHVRGIGAWSGGGGVGMSAGFGAFSFVPTASGAYGLGKGSREGVMAYEVSVSTVVEGLAIRDSILVQQNEIDQLRQEYIDYTLDVPARDEFAVAPQGGPNVDPDQLNQTVRRISGGTATGQYGVILNGTDLADHAQQIGAEYDTLVAAVAGAPGHFRVRVSSGYRNPYSNQLAKGCFSKGTLSPHCQGPSKHMRGLALDLTPGGAVAGQTRADLMQLVNNAVAAAGFIPLPELGAQHATVQNADHIHVEF